MTGPGSFAPISHPAVRHRLAAAIRFVDAFTGSPVTVPLQVEVTMLAAFPGMPRLPWRAVPAEDGTHRLITTGNAVPPAAAVALTVVAPGGEYADREPATILLPRPIAGPFPTRADMLVTHVLWPTRRLSLAPGEMAVVGTVRTAAGTPAANHRVRFADGALGPGTPYAYTDDGGDFLFRLPFVRALVGSPLGGTIRVAAPIDSEVRSPPAYATAIAPSSPTFPVSMPVGRPTMLLITIP